MRRTFFAVAAVAILLLGWGAVQFGPYFLPVRYSVTMTADLSVDGKRFLVSQGARCVVHRNLPRPGQPYFIEVESENPSLVLPDGRAVVLAEINPCRFLERPEQGRVYQLTTSGVLGLRGKLYLLDSAANPQRVEIASLADDPINTAGAKVELHDVSIKRDDQPVIHPLANDITYLAKMVARPHLDSESSDEEHRAYRDANGWWVISAVAAIGVEKCHPELGASSEKWVEVEPNSQCARKAAATGLLIGSDPRQITLDLTPTHTGTGTMAIRQSVPLALGIGQYRFAAYDWMAKVCLEADCFDLPLGTAYGYLRLYNPKQQTYVEITSIPGEVADMARAN